jgi:outer membrane receptor protein involved in Fe transport
LADTVRATLGARYTKEDRSSEGRSMVLSPLVDFTPRPEIHDAHWTGRASVDWAPMADTLVYGSVATGYKGGGFNTGSASQPTFDAETVTAYELGIKREWWDRTLRTNLSVFYNDYKDMQIAQRISAAAITSNADAVTKGVELELAFAPSRTWLLDANLSVLSTRIGDFQTVDPANPGQSFTATTPEVPVSLAGNQLPHSPKAKVKLGAQYSAPLFGTGWTATARLDHVWQDQYYAREFNTPTDRIAAWSVTNLQLRMASPGGQVEVKAFVKNLADKDNVTNIIIEDPLVGRYRNVRLLDPRTFGVQVQYNF